MVEQWVATCSSRQAVAVGEVIDSLSELLLPERHDSARSLQPFFAHARSPPVTADLHFDTYDNILWVILGRKRVWLLHRDSLPQMRRPSHGSLERTARYPPKLSLKSPMGLQRARVWRDVVHPLRVLALRRLRPQYACHQPVVLPSSGRSPPPSGGRGWPPDSRGTGHAQASADTVVLLLRLPARRPASPSFGDFLYISTPRRSRLFSMILPVRVPCIHASMCVHLPTCVPPLSSSAKVLVHLCRLFSANQPE